MTTALDGHISVDDQGVARIAGSRSRVTQIVLDHRSGLTPRQIADAYPHLTLAKVHAALTYYYDHQAELDVEIEQAEREYEAGRAATPQPTRDALAAKMRKRQPGETA